MKKTLILLRGVPGSGKTTVAKVLSEDSKYPIIAADDYFMEGEKYIFNPELLNEAHDKSQKRVEEEMIKATKKIFVHNTLTTEEELKPYYELSVKYGYRVFSLIVENRHEGRSNKDVPKDTINKMESRLKESIKLS
jgi:dephospho-CoA kinase